MGKKRDSKVDYWITEDGLDLIRSWSRDTFTKSEIANRMGVSPSTLNEWCEKYEEIDEAIRTTKEIVDYQVENALLKAALGYKTKEIKVTVGKKVINGETVELLKETTTKEVAPNVNAAIFWLNNRKFDEWKRNRDKIVEIDPDDNQVTITINRGAKKAIEVLDDEEIEVNNSATFTRDQIEEAEENDPDDDSDEFGDSDEWDDWEEEEGE